MKHLRPILAAGTLLLGGCASGPYIEDMSTAQVAAGVTVKRDEYRKVTTVTSPVVFRHEPARSTKYWLEAARHDGSPEASFQILLNTWRGHSLGWAFWSQAFDASGEQLPVLKHGSEVGNGGMTYELVGVVCKRSFLDARTATGLNIRIDGTRASQVIELPANYVVGFLARADEVFGSK